MPGPFEFSRRTLLASAAAGTSTLAVPAWARGASLTQRTIRAGFDEVTGPVVDLHIGEGIRHVEGRTGHAFAVNGSVPGPLIRLREGTHVTLSVHNHLGVDSSIHWHGLLVPFQYDGVPGISFPGIAPGGTFTARFPVIQSGTYWWHSHSGLQEQAGHYGPIVIEPDQPEAEAVDRDYVLLLSEFTPMAPHTIMKKLKSGQDGYFNYEKTSWTDSYPLTGAQRRSWAKMRMSPTDIADVMAPAYTYTANGRGPHEGTQFLFQPGERVRLRIINGSAMTFFNVRIPGLPMHVVAADGQPVRPHETDEFQISVAETYDVIVHPRDAAYTVVAESMGRSGMAVATLASAPGLRAPVPALRPPPILTMADMGMGAMSQDDMAGMDISDMDMGDMDMGAMDHDHAHDMSGKMRDKMGKMSMRDTALLPPQVKVGPGIDMVAMHPVDRMGDPGIGLADVGHRVLTYRDLVARDPGPDPRAPSRMMEIHLTGNMQRYMWSFDGRKFTAVTDHPIRFAHNERVRVKLVNDTMMAHPIHLHGHFFELVNGQGDHQPRKHTVIVQPGGSALFDLTANAPGDWAFHCHLLYHMHAGMFQIVSVDMPENAA